MASCQDKGDATPNRIVIAQLNKTKMCIKFTKGLCKESECRFAHSSEELREQPDLFKTAMCRAFARGSCSDAECKYAHGEEELRVSSTVYKTQLCNFFAKGHCKKGDNCRHAHGRKELRILQDAIPPMPMSTESPQATPKRGAKTTRALASPGLTRTPLADVSNNFGSCLPKQVYQTPEKPRKTGATHEASMRCSLPPASVEPVKLPLPSNLVATPPSCPPQEMQETVLPPPPGLAMPWHLNEDAALTQSFARAAAAAAISAQQHTMAANAASSAAMTWALMHTCLTPGTGKISQEDSLAPLSLFSPSKNEDRRWAL